MMKLESSFIYNRILERSKIIVCLFFAVFFLVGLAVFDDYGVHFDQGYNMRLAAETQRYIFSPQSGKLDFHLEQLNTHGPVFELPLYILPKVLGLHGTRETILLRHFMNF